MVLVKKVSMITLAGFQKQIRLKPIKLKYLINSKSYNKVEILHHIILLTIVGLFIGKSIYKPN